VRSKTATCRIEIGCEASLAGRAGDVSRSPYPSRAEAGDPAGMRGRRSNLPGEICVAVPSSELREPRGDLIAAQKSADGIVGHAVGKAIEALQGRKSEQRIGRAGNDDRRPERLGAASRTDDSWMESGRKFSTHWPWNRWIGVKPLSVVAKGPNRPRRNQHPKARL
jgi:hypothetical protein